MLFCARCKVEMTCVKTGSRVVYHGTSVYASDTYLCNGCGAYVAKTNDSSYHDPLAINHGDKEHYYHAIDG